MVAALAGAMFLTCTCLPSTAMAAKGDGYLSPRLSYHPIVLDSGWLHFPSLAVGGGWFITDFSVLEAYAMYGGTYGAGEFQQMWGAEASFRMLLDVTEWIPSFGLTVGYLGTQSATAGADHGLTVGVSGCLDYRRKREVSVGLCGQWAYPFLLPADTIWEIGLRVNLFLP